MALVSRELTGKTVDPTATHGGKDMLTVSQLEQQVNSSKAREVVGVLPGGRKCVIQQGNIFSVDDQWDCWVTPIQDGSAESLHWAAPSLNELVTRGGVHYAINILEMS